MIHMTKKIIHFTLSGIFLKSFHSKINLCQSIFIQETLKNSALEYEKINEINPKITKPQMQH